MKSIAWDIWLYCNYDCKFCNTKTKILPDKIKSISEILNAWQNIHEKYGRCKIYITGGEPFLYPNIFEIIKKIDALHDVHITTNLSFEIDMLVSNKISNKNIFINTTFHPFYVSLDTFLSKFIELQKSGYQSSVSYMCDDLQMSELLNYKKVFDSYGINITPSVYNGNNNSNNAVKHFIMSDDITCDDVKKDSIINSTFNYCDAGKCYACVNDSGDAFVCSVRREKLGNIFDNTFRFLENTIECHNKCFLLENKYSQKDIL
ncbi:MAG: radical SAM protein [Endomicrobiia bacterium]